MKYLRPFFFVALTTLLLSACATTTAEDGTTRRAAPPPGSHSPFGSSQNRDINEAMRDQLPPPPEQDLEDEPAEDGME